MHLTNNKLINFGEILRTPRKSLCSQFESNWECRAASRPALARVPFLLTIDMRETRSRYYTCAGNRTFRTGSGSQERTPSIEMYRAIRFLRKTDGSPETAVIIYEGGS